MIDYKEKIKNLHYETLLLESLEWDSDQPSALFEYVDSVLSQEILTHPENILNKILTDFGKSTRDCVEQIFKEITFTHNLHVMENTHEN